MSRTSPQFEQENTTMRRKTIRLVLLLLVCALLGGGCASSSQTGHVTPTPTFTPTPLPSAGTISATISGLGANHFWDDVIAASDSAVWVHNGAAGTLVRIDPSTNRVVATIHVGHGEGGVALGQGAVWVANPTDGTIMRIDPQTNAVAATITVVQHDDVVAIATSPGAVWVTDFSDNALIRIDPQTNRIVARIPNQPGITGVSYGAGSVWTCNHHGEAQGVVRLDPATNQAQAQINPAPNQGNCGTVVALDQTVWTTTFVNGDASSGKLERLDPATNMVAATNPSYGVPFHLAANEQGVWFYDPVGLYRVDPTTGRLAGMVAIQDPNGVGLGAGSVWVSTSEGTLLRIAPAS
jgi:DNA-binding beta-propeller fold protein YncE